MKREDVCVNDDNGERWSHLTGFKLHSITTSLPCKGKSNQYVRHILSLTSSSPLSQSHFLTLSLSHPLTPSLLIPSHLHPLLPTYLHLFQRNMFCQPTTHTARVLLTDVNYTESDEKHLCLQHAMYTSLMPSVHASSQALHSTLGKELASVCLTCPCLPTVHC